MLTHYVNISINTIGNFKTKTLINNQLPTFEC